MGPFILLSESFIFDFDHEALFTKDRVYLLPFFMFTRGGKSGLLVGSPALGGLFLLLPVLLLFAVYYERHERAKP